MNDDTWNIEIKNSLYYSAIGQELTMTMHLGEFSTRAKFNLCRDLLMELGITEEMFRNNPETEKLFNKAWETQKDKLWK